MTFVFSATCNLDYFLSFMRLAFLNNDYFWNFLKSAAENRNVVAETLLKMDSSCMHWIGIWHAWFGPKWLVLLIVQSTSNIEVKLYLACSKYCWIILSFYIKYLTYSTHWYWLNSKIWNYQVNFISTGIVFRFRSWEHSVWGHSMRKW